jgi:hypothetical protein
MFVTANQIFIFLVCIYAGLLSGIVYDFLYVLKLAVGGKWMNIILDIVFFIIFALIYIFVSFLFEFPIFRLYMFFATQLGLFMYIKSFHILIANGAKKIYNKLKQLKGKGRERRKT